MREYFYFEYYTRIFGMLSRGSFEETVNSTTGISIRGTIKHFKRKKINDRMV